jgi:t-SNARE complex subunit (syntaxin)
LEAIQSYQTVEQQHRQRYKQRLERQYKIVKPDATPEEVRAVVEDDNGGQVFSQAVGIFFRHYPCTRRDHSRVVLKPLIAADEH